jgi:hypothetical protein
VDVVQRVRAAEAVLHQAREEVHAHRVGGRPVGREVEAAVAVQGVVAAAADQQVAAAAAGNRVVGVRAFELAVARDDRHGLVPSLRLSAVETHGGR